MKISIKRQTNRSTTWIEGANCVNLFLQDIYGAQPFSMGLQTTEWGDRKQIEPQAIFSIHGRDYRMSVDFLEKLILNIQQ